jgi:DNA-binding MarR family transcriptional regulator
MADLSKMGDGETNLDHLSRRMIDRESRKEEISLQLVELTADLMLVFGRMKRAALAAPGAEGDVVHRGTEFAILDTVLRHKKRTVPDIAIWRGVKRQSVQAVVNKLVEAGSLRLTDNPKNRSSKYIEVTEFGLERYERITHTLIGRYASMSDSLRGDDLEGARRILAFMAGTFDVAD